MLGANAVLVEPLNVTFQWHALVHTRDANVASLDAYLASPRFEPGATYRVLRGAGDGKLGLYHVLLAGGRLDSEMFPESMAMHNFASGWRLRAAALRPARRLRDRVQQLHRVEAHERDRDLGPPGRRRGRLVGRRDTLGTRPADRTGARARRVRGHADGLPGAFVVSEWIARVRSRICLEMSRRSSFCFSSVCTMSH